MIFTELPLAGAWMIDVEPNGDERGFLARTFCEEEFGSRGLNTRWVQHSTVFSPRAGTLRGLHHQRAPREEIKLVRCTAGAVYDVIVDLRPGSPSYLGWHGTVLSAENRRAIYVPTGFAHGAQTIESDTELYYHMSEAYQPEAASTLRWDDVAVGVKWPMEPVLMAERDSEAPRLSSGEA